MAENTTDRRVRKTRGQLRQGLVRLMREKSIQDITVKELCEECDCCFSERMRKLFRKNEKNVLRFCNKKAKEKRRLQRVKKPM